MSHNLEFDERAQGLLLLLSLGGCVSNTIDVLDDGDGSGEPPATSGATMDGDDDAPPVPPSTSTSTSTSTTTSTTVDTMTTVGPTTATATVTSTTGPPDNEVCQLYAQTVEECYSAEDAAAAYEYCVEYLIEVEAQYGAFCRSLWEEFLVCLSQLDCREFGAGQQCNELLEEIQLNCP